ncbi:MAG: tetratricopeptide repeat protein [Planctomycetes bacterium]|nr:tetratricopeptide repeat protein [Planctomycetota bacterium]
MAIRFVCACGASIQAPDEFAGRKVRCPRCGNAAAVPVESAPTVLSIRDVAGERAATEVEQVVRNRPATGEPAAALGRYPVEGTLGRGGMGEVLRVRDPELGRSLAAKVMRRTAGEGEPLYQKFLAEARITGQLEHPNIPPVHELGVACDGRAYFTMKEVVGKDLAKVLGEIGERDGRRPSSHRLRAVRPGQAARSTPAARESSLHRLLQIFLKVADAVAFAHSKGVIHRDLKPANVMVGEFGEVLVMDWGLAKVVGDSGTESGTGTGTGTGTMGATQAGTVMGTPAYMPPEQATGEVSRLDQRSDIYSLGAILYEILTLVPPYTGGDVREVLDKVIEGKLRPPSRRAPGREIPRELEAAVLLAMASEPAERYQDVASFRADIEAYLAGRTLAAAEYNPWQLLAKWARRNKVAVAGGAATAAALLVGTFAVIYVAGRAEAERLRSVEDARLGEEARAREARASAATSTYEKGEALWEEAAKDEVFNEAAPQAYFQRHVAALLAMGGGYEEHPAPPEEWKGAVLEHLDLLESQAMEVGDWVLAETLVESSGNWGVRSPEEVAQARARVKERFEEAARKDVERLEAAIQEILARDKQGALLEGETDERARRLARSTGSGATRRALALLAEGAQGLARNYLATFLGKKADAHTRVRDLSAPDVILDALEEHAAAPDPRRADEALAWVRAAERFETIRPGTLAGLDDLLERLGKSATGPVAVEASGARERLGFVRAGRSPLAATKPGAEDWEQTLADLADLTLARSRSGRRYETHLVRRAGGEGELPLSGSAAAFVFEQIGLAGRSEPAAIQVLEAAFDRAVPRLAEGGREALEQASSSATALSRLAAPGFSEKLKDVRYESGPRSPFWNRTRLAFGLLRLDWAEPDSANDYINRGLARRDQGDLAGAIMDFTRAIELDPNNAIAYSNRGAARSDQGDLAGAITDHTRAIELDPNNAIAYDNRGAARGEQGDLAGAIMDFTRAIELDPNNATACSNRGAARGEQGDLAGAILDYTRAIELDPNNAWSYSNRGAARSDQGDLAGAILDCTRAIELDPKNWQAWANRGIALARLGKREEARASFDGALERCPDSQRAAVEVVRRQALGE